MRLTVIRAAIAAAAASALGGCFTGIESTPRISESDVRNSGVRTTAEQELMRGVAAERPSAWHPGKQWIADDPRISMIFTSASGATNDIEGDTITLRRIGTYKGVTGAESVELVFTRTTGDSLYYRPDVKVADIGARQRLDIPFAVELTPVETAGELLRGHTFYITTPYWYDEQGHPARGLRHVPVTITSVTAGTSLYPLRIGFDTPDAPATRYVMMTYGTAPTATRNFDRLFSITDPRDNYPRISAETWQKIVHSQVAEGMNRDECRLALGTPASINRGASSAGQYERWNYDNGIYLIFEEGILIRYRN